MTGWISGPKSLNWPAAYGPDDRRGQGRLSPLSPRRKPIAMTLLVEHGQSGAQVVRLNQAMRAVLAVWTKRSNAVDAHARLASRAGITSSFCRRWPPIGQS